MNPLFAAALEVEDFCRDREWEFCFIGGIVVLRWGEPRLTRDVDLTVLTGYGTEEPYIEGFTKAFPGRVDDAAGFARRNRVLLLRTRDGTPIDVALGALPFEERAVRRASEYVIGEGQSLTTCGAEDLIIQKAFAGRDRDWADIEGVVLRQGKALDHEMIWGELRPLLALKGDDQAGERLSELLSQA